MTTGVSSPEPIAHDFDLSQNHPNPFNPRTEMTVRLATSGHVTLKVYDLLGREADVLLDSYKEAGEHTISWDATGFPSGVYLCRMSVRSSEANAGDFVQTRKLVLLR
jgi:hypothetical protein